MPSLDVTHLEFSSQSSPLVDVIATKQAPTSTATIEPAVVLRPRGRLDEPSSMTLALIGIVTLVAYRSVHKRIAAHVTPKPAVPRLVKPRRRAA